MDRLRVNSWLVQQLWEFVNGERRGSCGRVNGIAIKVYPRDAAPPLC